MLPSKLGSMSLPSDSPPAEELRPTYVPTGEDPAARATLMRELRELSLDVRRAYAARDERLLALACSQTLSRRDMATATGLAKSRVDQIIAARWQAHQERLNVAAAERVRRHLPSAR